MTADNPTYLRETQHSMLRRCNHWDYKGRGIYMFTLVVNDRQPLLGEVKSADGKAYMNLSDLGKIVADEAEQIPMYYPQVRVLCKQVMPDHLHLLLFVETPLPVHVGSIINGFKFGSNRAYWNAFSERTRTEHLKSDVSCAAVFGTAEESVSCARSFGEREKQPGFWSPGYHDRILFYDGQLDAMIHYIKDNPRRLWLKRNNPDLFRIHQRIPIASIPCTTLGNMFLYESPFKAPLHCSRSLSQIEIDSLKKDCLTLAAHGIIFVSPAVSEGEKQVCRALREAGYPLIILLNEGFPAPDSPHYKYYKPSGVYFEACAAGNLLLVEPSTEIFDLPDIETTVFAKTGPIPHTTKRYRFLALNALADRISSNILA